MAPWRSTGRICDRDRPAAAGALTPRPAAGPAAVGPEDPGHGEASDSDFTLFVV